MYRVLFLSFVTGMLAVHTGCRTNPEKVAARTENLLIAAGFEQEIATTPEKKAMLDKFTPLQLQKYVKNGKFRYVFADPVGCNCAYVGGEEQYAEYRRLAIERQIAEENRRASELGAPYWRDWP